MFVRRILPAILVVIPAAFVATMDGGRSEPAADQCKTKPGLSVERGTHWYYRLDHLTKRRCWYLSLAGSGQHTRANAPEVSAAAPTVPVAQENPAAIQKVQPPQWQAGDVTPPALAPSAAASLVELSVRNEQDAADFATRWPSLPLTDISSVDFGSQNKSAAGPSSLSDSYAEKSADEDTLPDAPLRWPVVEGVAAQPDTSIVAAVQPLYFAGGAVMALLFLAGWSFGQIRGRRIHIAPAPVNIAPVVDAPTIAAPMVPAPMATKGGKYRPDGHAGAAEASALVTPRPAVRGRPTPTDPARDLKKSLGELMRDLQRADAVEDTLPLPVRKPKRRNTAAQKKAMLMEVAD